MSAAPITASADFEALARDLTARAQALAEAQAAASIMARAGNEDRWRRADLIWPTIAKG